MIVILHRTVTGVKRVAPMSCGEASQQIITVFKGHSGYECQKNFELSLLRLMAAVLFCPTYNGDLSLILMQEGEQASTIHNKAT